VMLSAGGALRWLRQTIAPAVDYGALDAAADIVPPGAEGLVFLPYLTGERTPYPDPTARGAFVGLSLVHGRGHLVRAVMEGVAFGLRDSFEIIRAMGIETTQVRATGGGAASRLWNQILADVLGVEVVVMNITEGAAYGAALLAGVGAGLFPTIDTACEARLRVANRAEPRPNVHARYNALYETYRALYPALRPSFERLAEAPVGDNGPMQAP
jgi:xylulokinase